jgi:hypothetical protein
MKKAMLVSAILSLWALTANAQSGTTRERFSTTETQPSQRISIQKRTRTPRLGSGPIANALPVILDYSPLFGLPGTVVTIQGTGFGAPQGSNSVYAYSLINVNASGDWPDVISWSDTQIVVRVPSTMPLGLIYLFVEINQQYSKDWHPFTVGIPPLVFGSSPESGLPGTLLTINGKNFGQTQGNSSVSVLSSVTRTWITWTPTSWSDTEIVVTVPNNMPLGLVWLYVTVNKLDSIGVVPFTVGTPATVTGSSPQSGDPGTVLTIYGKGFGSSSSGSYVSVLSSVTHTWTTWTPTSWSDNEIVVTVPSRMPLGLVWLNVTVNNLASIGVVPFTVGMPATVIGTSPQHGDPGTVLTIYGKGFGSSASGSYVSALSSVTYTSTTWTPISWSDTEIVVTVPSNMPLGAVWLNVTVNNLNSVGVVPFTVGTPPTVANYSPGLGPAGTVVRISGKGFGTIQGSGLVTLVSLANSRIALTPVSWSDTQIFATVPSQTANGYYYLSVTVGGLQSLGIYPFQVQ